MDLYAVTDNMILAKIGESIKRQRLERNISQKELAVSTGISISSVAALERGESVSLKTLIPLLRTLGALHSLSDFLKEPDFPWPNPMECGRCGYGYCFTCNMV